MPLIAWLAIARGRPVMMSVLVARFGPDRRDTALELATPFETEGDECDATRITFVGVEAGSTVSPSVSREPSVPITSSLTTVFVELNVTRWIFPNISAT